MKSLTAGGETSGWLRAPIRCTRRPLLNSKAAADQQGRATPPNGRRGLPDQSWRVSRWQEARAPSRLQPGETRNHRVRSRIARSTDSASVLEGPRPFSRRAPLAVAPRRGGWSEFSASDHAVRRIGRPSRECDSNTVYVVRYRLTSKKFVLPYLNR